MTAAAIWLWHRRRACIEAGAIMSCDQVIYLLGIGMHEVRIVCISGQQGRSSARERRKMVNPLSLRSESRAPPLNNSPKAKQMLALAGPTTRLLFLEQHMC